MTQPETTNQLYADYDEIDLRDIIKILNKWRYTITAVTLICMFISGIISFYFLDPVYEASTVVSITQTQDNREIEGEIEDVVNELGQIPYMGVQACEHQVKSPEILQATIKKLDLDYTRRQLTGMIKTENPDKTDLITITVSNTDPDLAAQIANTIRAEVVANVNKINTRKMEQSLAVMQEELLAKEEKELKTASDELKKYKLEVRSIEFLTTQLQQKNQDLATIQSQIVGAEIQCDELRKGIEQDKINIENTPATIATTSSAQGVLPVEINGLDVKNGQVTSESVNEAYMAVVQSYNEKTAELAGTESAIATARQKTIQLEEEVRQLEAELINSQIEEQQLQNEVDRREKVVTLLTSKIADLNITRALDLAENNITTVSEAFAPEVPVKPKKMFNIAIAGILGLMLATFAVFFIEYMKNGEEETK